jgi:nitrous oxidase accessory protein NosD
MHLWFWSADAGNIFSITAGNQHMTSLMQRYQLSVLLLIAALMVIAGIRMVFAANQKEPAEIVFASDTVVSGDIVIPESKTGKINPGVRIQFEGYGRFIVQGLLIAEGTTAQPIEITGSVQGTHARQKTTWKGLEIIGAKAHAQMKHCRIFGAYRNLVWESSPVFDSCDITGNHFGLYCAKQAQPHIKRCKIFGNVYGIVADLASPLLLDNSITGNIIGLHLKLCSESIIGRNVITGNEKNIFSEQILGENKGSMSIHYLWNIVNQLY